MDELSYVNEESMVDIKIYRQYDIETLEYVEYPNIKQLNDWVDGFIQILPGRGYELVMCENGSLRELPVNTLFLKDYGTSYLGNIVVISVAKEINH